MNNKDIPYTLGDYFDVIRRRWIYVATVLPTAVLIALYVAYTLPPVYRSSGVIILEPSSIPQDMIRTTVTSYAGQYIELVQRQLLAPDNLKGLIAKIDPYPGEDLSYNAKAAAIAENTQIEHVDPITLEPVIESPAFSMSYSNPDPAISVAIARELVEMFLDVNRDSRVKRAGDNFEFLSGQSKDARADMTVLEHKLADFKAKHGDAMPDVQSRNFQAQDRTERDLDGTLREIRLAEEKKALLELQLNQINPRLFDPAGDWRTQLNTLQAQLAEARQRYSEDHPTVRRLTRSIEEMSARNGAAQPSTPVTPDNPNYIQVANQLDAAKRELAALNANADRARAQLKEYERSAKLAPEVEREFNQVLREYQVAQQRFEDIQKSLNEAELGRSLESEQRGERFTLIRNPSKPSRPASPNRLGILLLGIVLGGALAVGLAAFRESSDPTIRSARDLLEFTDIRPIGAVPFLPTAEDRRKRVIAWTAASIVFAVAALFVGATVVQASPW
ncbi:MAG: hypothetical protein ABI640_02185 [Gammaproteobacteria bacterium]